MFINRPDVEFIEEGHLYLHEGVLTPSVSEILKFVFPDKYKGIPDYILNNKASFGTEVHKSIEDYEETQEVPTASNIDVRLAFQQYLRVKDLEVITPLYQEEIIAYKGLYAGRLDMVADVRLFRSLLDIKTTSELDKEYLSWQLGMYKLAWEELNPKQPLEKCYCLWLPKKNLGQLVEIQPKSKEEIEKVLEDYAKV